MHAHRYDLLPVVQLVHRQQLVCFVLEHPLALPLNLLLPRQEAQLVQDEVARARVFIHQKVEHFPPCCPGPILLSALHLVRRFRPSLIFPCFGLNLKNESLLLHVDLGLSSTRTLAHALEEGVYEVLIMRELIKERVRVAITSLAHT